MSTIYHGETTCQKAYPDNGKKCSKKAYYMLNGKALCGMHSKTGNRKQLPKNPRSDEVKAKGYEKHQEIVEKFAEKNRKLGKPGDVICSKLRMMRKPDDIEGYLKVFPNFKHQNRKDGFGCAALSPMSLGPINHRQKDLPPSKNLENYHQFNKVYACEAGKDGKPTEAFYKLLKKAYKSPDAKRHKYDKKKQPKTKEELRVLYSIHKDSEGKERRYDYRQSRYFYCHFYETLAKEQADFKHLQDLVAKGTNIQIIGYDSYEVNKDLMHHYRDVSKPFGHELCLYTMLKVKDSKDYPWNQYYEGHKHLYPEYLAPDYGKKTEKKHIKHSKDPETEEDDKDIMDIEMEASCSSSSD